MPLFYFFCFTVSAQQKILLLNGKTFEIKDVLVKNENITFKKFIRGKERSRSIDKLRVFSVNKADGSELIVYDPDTALDLSVSQMRIYMEGEQAASKYFNKPLNVVAGVTAGLVGSYFTFYGLPIPLLYGTISGRISPKVRLPEDAIYINQKTEEFRDGYQRKAREIKTRQTLIAGLVGFAISVTFFPSMVEI